MEGNIQLFLHGNRGRGYWISMERLWKNRTFPQSPQVFPQGFSTVKNREISILGLHNCFAFFRQTSHFFACQKTHNRHTPVRKKGLDKVFSHSVGLFSCVKQSFIFLKKFLTIYTFVTIMIGSANADISLLPARPGA